MKSFVLKSGNRRVPVRSLGGWWIAILFGMIAASMGAATAAQDSATIPILDLEQLVKTARAKGERVVRLQPGRFRVKPATFSKVSDLTIEGIGTVLVAEPASKVLLRFSGCQNITLRGFGIDYDPLPFTQGTVTAQADDLSWCDVKLHDGFPAFRPSMRHLHLFDAVTTRWKDDTSDPYSSAIEDLGGGMVRVRFEKSPWRIKKSVSVGDWLAFADRPAGAILFDNLSTNIRVEEITIYTAPGYGVMARYIGGNNYFSYKITRGPTPTGALFPRLLSTTADGFNYAHARQGPIVEKCEFSFMGDDAVNLHGPVATLLQSDSSRVLYFALPSAGPLEKMLKAGDALRILDSQTFAPKGTVLIDRVERGDVSREVLSLYADGAYLKRLMPNSSTEQRAQRAVVYRVFLKETAAIGSPGDLCDFPALNTPGFLIKDNYFHDHRGISIRNQASDGEIVGNLMERIRQNGITIGPEYRFWRESGWCSNVVISGNTLRDIGLNLNRYDSSSFGAISVSAKTERGNLAVPQENHGIVIEGNRIERSSFDGIFVAAASGTIVRNNIIENVDRRPSLVGDGVTAKGVESHRNLFGYTVGLPINVSNGGPAVVENNVVDGRDYQPPTDETQQKLKNETK